MTQPIDGWLPHEDHGRFKSGGERKIAQLLDAYGLRYQYERPVLLYERDKPRIWHPDFFLPDFATYIEYYGGAGQPEYDRGIDRKTSIYRANSIDVIPIYPWTFRDEWQDYIVDSLEAITSKRTDLLPKNRSPPLLDTYHPPHEMPATPAYAMQNRNTRNISRRHGQPFPNSRGRYGARPM